MGNNGALAAGGAIIAVGVGGGLYYGYTRYQKLVAANGGAYISPSGNAGYFAWLLNGMPQTWNGGVPPPSGKTTFSISPSSVSLSSGIYIPDSVTISGSGFAPSSAITFVLGSQSSVAAADSSGDLPATAIALGSGAFGFVPAAGTYTITASDDYGHSASATLTVTGLSPPPPVVDGTISVSPEYVPSPFGNVIMISGSGFNAFSLISIYSNQKSSNGTWSGKQLVARNVSTGIDGNFGNLSPYQVSLPAASGTVEFSITTEDASGRGSNAVLVFVTGTPTLTVTPNPLSQSSIASVITITGTGFGPNDSISFDFRDGAGRWHYPSATATADSGGYFSVSYLYPLSEFGEMIKAAPSGACLLIAGGTSGASVQIPWTIGF